MVSTSVTESQFYYSKPEKVSEFLLEIFGL